MSLTVQTDYGTLTIPERARESLTGFREWAGEDDLPEKARVDFHKGEVWFDMSQEQIFTHGDVKSEIAMVLRQLSKQMQLGRYWCNGILVTNIEADLSGNPDGTFLSFESLEAGRVTLTEGANGGYVELVGTVDMVLEVVSVSSVKKDRETLRTAYWEAGIPEYWLVDARHESIEFHIFKQGPKGYIESRRLPGGWAKSNVFGKAFRLTRADDRHGHPQFTLEVK